MLLLFFISAISSIFLLLLLKQQKKNEPKLHPPPGPKGLPIIGNLHEFNPLQAHVYFTNLAKHYGSVTRIRLGYQSIVVIQSAKMAKEVLQTQDTNFCNRLITVGSRRLSYNGLDLILAPYGEYFREIKKIFVVHLLSAKRVQSFAPIRQELISKLIERISSLSSASKVVNLSDLLVDFSSSIICKIAFGRWYKDDEGSRSRLRDLLNETQAFIVEPYYSDYFPCSGWLDKLIGKYSRLEKRCKKLDEFYEEIISFHLDPNNHNSEQEDIVDILLQLKKEGSLGFELTMDHIKAVIMDIILAGADTSTAMVIWVMTELMKNPNAMEKVQEELRNAIQHKGYIVETDLLDLEYFKAIIKESFRLHPATPLLMPRNTLQQTVIDGYDIVPKDILYINLWAIGREVESWKDPDLFMPERFLGNSINFLGRDFELIPFGAGRRICPGIHLGLGNLELMLANLLYHFDWELPSGTRKEDIDTDVKLGVVMHKKTPLYLKAIKSSQSVDLTS